MIIENIYPELDCGRYPEVGKKVEAGQNVELKLVEGRGLVEDAFSATGEGVWDDGGLVCGSEGFRRGAP